MPRADGPTGIQDDLAVPSFFRAIRAATRPFRSPPGVIVASFGRSGSTMLYYAAAKAMRRRRPLVPKSETQDFAWTLGEKDLRQGVVYKTHDYPSALAGRSDLRTLFVFGPASDAALSVLRCLDTEGPDWVAEHFDHMKSDGTVEEILERDALGLERQLDEWSAFADSPVLCVKYDSLWPVQQVLRDFTDLKISLPPQRPRSKKQVSSSMADAIGEVYGALDRRIEALPDVFVGGSLR